MILRDDESASDYTIVRCANEESACHVGKRAVYIQLLDVFRVKRVEIVLIQHDSTKFKFDRNYEPNRQSYLQLSSIKRKYLFKLLFKQSNRKVLIYLLFYGNSAF